MVNKFLLCFVLTFISQLAQAQSGPGGIGTKDGSSALEVWLKANRGVTTNSSNNVTSWADSSGNGIEASPRNAPDFNSSGLNGKPTISFDASNNEYLNLSSAIPTGSNGEVTVFMVFKPSSQVTSTSDVQTLLANDGTVSNSGIIALGDTLSSTSETFTFGRYNGSNIEGYIYNNNISSSFLIHNFDYNGTSANYYQDNGSFTLNTVNSGFSSSFSLESLKRIGANAGNSNHFNGEIAEIIVYSRQLNNDERNIVANYLDAKYQVNELSSNDFFINSQTYNHDPAGITPTNNTSLKAGGLEIADSSNTLSSGNNVFAAHDDSTGTTSYTNKNNSGQRWSRGWKLEFSGNFGGGDRIDIAFNFNDNFGPNNLDPRNGSAGDYELLESTDGSFSNPTTITPGQNRVNLYANKVSFEPKIGDLTTGSYYTLASEDTTNSPLPVEWLYFKGVSKNNQHILKWGTATETNARHFKVQRSASGNQNFQNIATVKASGTTVEQQDYTATDNIQNSQIYYYRLKQVDFDGNFEYSNIIALEKDVKIDESKLNLLKNPIPKGQPIRYQTKGISNALLTVRLFDATGQLRAQEQLSAKQGSQILKTSNLSPGVYWLQIQTGEKRFNKKLVVAE